MQLTVAKDSTKLKPYAIFKGASFNGTREHRRRTIANELYYRLEDNTGNSYPLEEKIYLTCSESGSSSGILTKDILEHVILPYLKVEEENRSGILLDNFKGHSTDIVKQCVKSFKSGDKTDDDEDRYYLINYHIMCGGITPKSQLLDIFQENYERVLQRFI